MIVLRCSCGGRAWRREELIALGYPDSEKVGYPEMWRSIMGPLDLYCADEDEVLTEEEGWRARGLQLPVHDPTGRMDWPVHPTLGDMF